MKKILVLCCLLLVNIAVNAQATSPTKEQTVQFIKDYYEESNKTYTDYKENELDFERYEYRVNSILFDYSAGVMTVNFEQRFYYHRTEDPSRNGYKDYGINPQKEVAINFKVCESILLEGSYVGSHVARDKVVKMGLRFRATPGKTIGGNTIASTTDFKDKSTWIPLEFYKCDDCDDKEINKKILQAFNHLRKLCGAPEPISFDEK